MTLDWISIIQTIITLISGCGWLIDRMKHRQEIESLKTDNCQKDKNFDKESMVEWCTFITEPLQQEVGKLCTEVKQLCNSIQCIDNCPHRDNCPVYDELCRQAKFDD